MGTDYCHNYWLRITNSNADALPPLHTNPYTYCDSYSHTHRYARRPNANRYTHRYARMHTDLLYRHRPGTDSGQHGVGKLRHAAGNQLRGGGTDLASHKRIGGPEPDPLLGR